MAESIQTGQSYSIVPLWGLVEDRLVKTLEAIWDLLADDPQLDIDEAVTQNMNRVAHSLNLTLWQH